MLKVAVSPIRERGQISLGVGLILTLLTLTSGGAIYHYQNQTIKLSRQLDDLQRDRAEARGEQQRRDGLLQERERELEMVRGERQRDAETIASLRQNGDAMEQRAEAAEQLLSREQTALTGLRQQLAATREQMEQTLQQQRDERQRVELSLQQGRDELSRITREQARLSEQKRTLEDQLTQGGEVNRGLREENRELRERLAQLQTQLEALNLDQEQLQQLQEHLARERSRVRQLHDRTADLQESNQSLKQRLDQVNQTLEKELSARQMTIKCFQQRLEIILLDSMLYPSGSARLSPQGRNALRQLAPLLRQSAPRVIQVSGHTDNRPFRQDVTSPYSNNWALSSARATEVVRYLIGEGVEAERLVALGHADTRPVGDNETPEGRSQNRRIEIFVRGGYEG